MQGRVEQQEAGEDFGDTHGWNKAMRLETTTLQTPESVPKQILQNVENMTVTTTALHLPQLRPCTRTHELLSSRDLGRRV